MVTSLGVSFTLSCLSKETGCVYITEGSSSPTMLGYKSDLGIAPWLSLVLKSSSLQLTNPPLPLLPGPQLLQSTEGPVPQNQGDQTDFCLQSPQILGRGPADD